MHVRARARLLWAARRVPQRLRRHGHDRTLAGSSAAIAIACEFSVARRDVAASAFEFDRSFGLGPAAVRAGRLSDVRKQAVGVTDGATFRFPHCSRSVATPGLTSALAQVYKAEGKTHNDFALAIAATKILSELNKHPNIVEVVEWLELWLARLPLLSGDHSPRPSQSVPRRPDEHVFCAGGSVFDRVPRPLERYSERDAARLTRVRRSPCS